MLRRLLLLTCLLLCSSALLACVPLITAPLPPASQPSPSPIADFPLSLGDTWIYSGTRYDIAPGTLVQRITETVVNVTHTLELSGTTLYVAEIQRDVTPIEVPANWSGGDDFTVPSQSRYWYILRENNVYRQNDILDLTDVISNSQLEFVFPLESSLHWYLIEEMRQLNPDFSNDSFLRRLSEIGSFTSPARLFQLCYLYSDVVGGWVEQARLCPQVGVVERKGEHDGTPFGLHEVLIDYSIHYGKPITMVETPMIERLLGPPECLADGCIEFTDGLDDLPLHSEAERSAAIEAIRQFVDDSTLQPENINTGRDSTDV